MGVSSNSVIHFTNDRNKLQGILEQGFKVKYCFEKISIKNNDLSFGVPMVSFCDIPLSEVKNHISKYGSYGIGLKKEWAIKNALNPVLYLETNSSLGINISLALANYGSLNQSKDELKRMLDILRYMKNYQHDLIRNGEVYKDYRFYDEREWRYVPNVNTEGVEFVLSPQTYSQYKDEMNESASKLKLRFEPVDISYIILNDESEISDFIVFLRNIFKRSPFEDVDTLITRIMTVDQIYHDF